MEKASASVLNRNKNKKRQDGSLAILLTLTLWRLRQTWRQLFMIGVALLTACTIACVPPIFTAVADTAGLQGLFNGASTRTTFALNVNAHGISSATVPATLQSFEKVIRPGLGSYLDPSAPSLVIKASQLTIVQPERLHLINPLNVYTTSIQRLEPALHLVQGHWANAQMTNGAFEFMLTTTTAQALNLAVGNTLTVQSGFVTAHAVPFFDARGEITLRLAGIFADPGTDLPALHGETFQPVVDYTGTSYTFLMADTALLQACDQIAARENSTYVSASKVDSLFRMSWYFHLNTTQIQFGQTSDLTSRVANVQYKIVTSRINNSGDFPYVNDSEFLNPPVDDSDIFSLLNQYISQVAIINLPLSLLALQIIALLLFFACLLVNQLIDRQLTISAQFSSRGASPGQMLWSLIAQVAGLCILALVLGPILGILIVYKLASQILPASEYTAISGLFNLPGQMAALIAPYLAGTFLLALLATGLPCRRASNVNILELRRETTRSSNQPFWLRYYLDLLVALLALSGFGVALYLAQVARVLDIKTQELVIAPLTLVTPVFLLIGGLLLFLRAFPVILGLAVRLSRPARGTTSLLALVQMARSPHQAMRLIMLLALATTFASFSLIFDASQNQRAVDIAAYESGADFAGDLPGASDAQARQALVLKYNKIPGVLATSAGYINNGTGTGLGSAQISIALRAVDAHSFSRVAIWESQDSTQSLDELMNTLLQHGPTPFSSSLIVPAIVDETTMSNLHLTPGYIFDVSSDYGQAGTMDISFQVVAVIQHIPGVNGSPGVTDTSSFGGLLVDFQALNQAYINAQAQIMGTPPSHSQPLPFNHLWLRTGASPQALASTRAALSSSDLALSNLYDRRAITVDLQSDPLVFSILLMLNIGGITALILAFLGNLLASWLNVRLRLNSFVVLRALGATNWQVMSILLWEQGIVYLTAFLLSLGLGGMLAWLVVPKLIFTGLPSRGVLSELSAAQFYLLQRSFPTQTVIPSSLQLALAILVLACGLALLLMARVVLSASSAQELRLNED